MPGLLLEPVFELLQNCQVESFHLFGVLEVVGFVVVKIGVRHLIQSKNIFLILLWHQREVIPSNIIPAKRDEKVGKYEKRS